MSITASRYHDFSAGHRVLGHENKCAHLHGHNYRVHFTVESVELDDIGRVLDFSEIKDTLCQWLEENWDHKFLLSEQDPLASTLTQADPAGTVLTPFNPTAENMAEFLLYEVGPELLTNARLVEVRIEETRKCWVTARLPNK